LDASLSQKADAKAMRAAEDDARDDQDMSLTQ
jgi:hypothetical protein